MQGGYRPPSFYKQIKKLPNVILYHRVFPSIKLVENCEMVVTIQGTVGLEALLRNKKVLLLSRAFYDSIYGIEKENNYKDLHNIIKRYLLESLDIKRQDLSIMAFLKAWSDITYSEDESTDIKNDKILKGDSFDIYFYEY